MYRRRWVGDHGVTVQAGNKMGTDEIHVRLPGEACEALGLVNVLALASLLNLRATRLDAAADYCPFTPQHLYEARKRGLVRTHAQAWDWRENHEGTTFYLGSRASGQMLRAYDRRGFTRTELEMRRGHAQALLARLFEHGVDAFPRLVLGAIRAFVEFVDTRADTNISRCPPLPWWRDFVGVFERVRIAPRRVQPTVGRYLAHARRYAALFHVYVALVTRQSGRAYLDVVNELFTHGSMRLRVHHQLLLAQRLV
jgi:DNA relaxase NicK